LLVHRVYSYVQLVADRSAAVSKMGELFSFLVEHPDRVSAGYRENLSEMPVYRVVCDYIAGMTDSYFTRTYESLLDG
jgi:dGTPase